MSAFRALVALILSVLLALCADREARAELPRDGKGNSPRFAYEGFEEALGCVAWAELGRELAELQPMLAHDAEFARPNRKVAPLRRSILDRMNRLAREGVPGSGPHGVFTHPAVLVNAIHFTLDKADRPLTGLQADELYLIGSQFVAADVRRRKSCEAERIALARLVEEAELKGRMFTWLRASLTPSQQSLLHPEAARDAVGWTFFDSCAVLGPHARAITFSSRAQLLDQLAREHAEVLGLTAAEAPIVRGHLAKFVSDLGEVPREGGVLPRAHTLAMARRTVALRRALVKDPSLRESVRRRIAAERSFRVPLRVSTPLADTAR